MKIPILAALGFFLLTACVTRPVPEKFQKNASGSPFSVSTDEEKIIRAAEGLLGRSESSRVEIRGKTFTLDCTGTVLAAFYGGLGLDLARDFNRFTGNGVKRLYATLKQLNLLHRRKLPAPGDIIFWDNTWDANEDGNFRNDELTHTGLVVAVDKDGTVSYIHAHIRRGVVREVMNLALPREREDAQGKPLNSPLALATAERRKTEEPSGGFSGNLWNSFGSAVRRKDYFAAPPPP